MTRSPNKIVISETVPRIHGRGSPIQVVLLHELVHFVPYYDGEYERAECKQALEIDAFELQDQWIDPTRYRPRTKE